MSRHQAYRNYDYENDLDEYEGENLDDEEDELSPEDRAQMTAGTSQVRAQLGAQSSKISTQQIEEALWHYYYDVEKSVAYLITKYVAAKPAKPQKIKNAGSMTHKHTSFSDFFHDMPWLHIPDDRRAVFVEPVRPPGGLLGGSKLQALAAARKKKAEEQKSENQISTPATTQTAPETAKAAEKRVGPLSQRLNAVRLGDSPSRAASQIPVDGMELDGASADPVPPTGETEKAPEEEEYVPPAPSAFAQTLFGSSGEPTPQSPRRFPMPWMMYTSPDALTNAFSEPSPDDKVLAAQAKGSLPAKKA
ncbi:HBS1 N-terminus-domain-containing protein [Xylariaceae sp. FL1019]|nr:HBS1 N-terminus-domain-containing protein [Xylariaceae sp. FL1019]